MELLLLSHIVLFSASLLLAGSGTIAAATGHQVPKRIMTANIAITILGVATGLVLLLTKPLGVYCAALLGYVAVFACAQVYMSRRNQRLASSSDV